MALDISRRGLITGLISFAVTAPAIVRATNLMPIKTMVPAFVGEDVVWRTDHGSQNLYYIRSDGRLCYRPVGGEWVLVDRIHTESCA